MNVLVDGTFIDQEAGVDEQPVAILLRRLQGQGGRQLVLQEGECHALLQVVGGGGEAGCQAPGAAGTHRGFNARLTSQILLLTV